MTVEWWHIAIGVAGLGGVGWLASRAGLLSLFKDRKTHRTQGQIKEDQQELKDDYEETKEENASGRAADHAAVDDFLSNGKPPT